MPQVDIQINTNFNEITLALPNFDPISKFPNISGDQRIIYQKDLEKLSQKNKKPIANSSEKISQSVFSFKMKLRTPKKLIRIKYALFKPEAKFRIQGDISDKHSNIVIRAEPFKVKYLEREATLEKFILKNNSNQDAIELDGQFSIKKADYTLYVDILQKYDKPRIELTSKPPLPEEDIISLILFNQLSSNINSSYSNSVENTKAAMTQKTVGFFSFFVLASTPVESVSYNPSTGTYAARIKLPGGFTGSVGSDWDKSQEVGIRKSLGGNWVISAGVGTDSQGEDKQESMLEWFYRY